MALKNRYLFLLAENKEVLVREVAHMGGEARQVRIRWKMSMSVEERKIEKELSEKVHRLTLREEVDDKWECLEIYIR
jgi:hypothetical protein